MKRVYNTSLFKDRLHLELAVSDELWYSTLQNGNRITYIFGLNTASDGDLKIWKFTIFTIMIKIGFV